MIWAGVTGMDKLKSRYCCIDFFNEYAKIFYQLPHKPHPLTPYFLGVPYFGGKYWRYVVILSIIPCDSKY